MAAYAALLSLAHTTDLTRPQYESIFASDAAEKVRSIHDYVNFLLSFFEEFPEKVNRWEYRIRDVASDAEDIIEVFVWQQIQSRRDSTIYPSPVLEDQLQDVIIEIGSIAGEVMEERPPYRPPPSSSSSRLAAASNDAVVGLEEDVMKLMEQLSGQSSKLQVIPIVGMGGIGKSTLARTLYDHRYMLETFHIRAWVVVSQDYNPHRFRKILFDSMRLLDKEQTSGDEMDDSEFALKVYQNLKGRRYLIVIDDIWSTEVWDDVRNIFPDDNNGSRIMLTTRQSDVATYPGSNSPVHEMQFMNEAQCWDLLKHKVFGNSNCPHELEDVGKEIARRCAGLPLAVVLIAGVLSQENTTQASWQEIAKNVNPVVGREIGEILSLSYTYLPHHLRPCFLFTGYFVEDVNISSSRLIRLWVAEGFVKHKHGCSKSLEEEAEEYLEDLVKRNLMIVTSRKSDGKIKSCSLHDMVRGSCMSKAHEEKFLHERYGRYLPLMNKRRIIFSHSDKTTIWGAAFLTILGFQNIANLLRSYTLLRVLDALAVGLNELPSEAFELYHLRYLAVMGSFSIPSLVYNLVNLQTLIVHLASGKPRERFDDGVPRSLPLEIWRMPQLRHVFFHAPYMLPHPLEGINYPPLENLQTLLHVQDLVWNKEIIRMIPNVKKLGLHYTTSQEYHLYHLKDMLHLVKLEVAGYLKFFWSRQIPRSFPCTLKKLTLVGGGFPWKAMVVVGLLPCLQVLKLLGYACNGYLWEITNEEYPQLKVLLIDGSYVRKWITHGSPFSTLKHLVLRSCRYLREIPEDVGEIPTLELIEVDDCKKSLLESAKKIKEEQEENYGNDALQVRIGHEDNLSTLMKEEIGVIIGLEKEMKKLSSTLTTIQAVLEGAKDKQMESRPIRDWLRKLYVLSYEIVDILDDCNTHVSKLNSARSKVSYDPILYRDKIGRRMEHVTERLDSVAAERAKFHLVEMPVDRHKEKPSAAASREPGSLTKESDTIYGRDEERDKIVKMLVEDVREKQETSVLPIIGVGGLGKTTLAQLVYNDPRVVHHFERRIWVCVSDDFNIKTLVTGMTQKRYLIVLDDVSYGHEEKWLELKSIVSCGSKGASVIVTTRLKMVADIMATLPPHRLRGLSDEHCWMLLKQRAFGQQQEEEDETKYPELEGIGKQIVKKCAGVPLIAKALGVILRFKRRENEWMHARDSQMWELLKMEDVVNELCKELLLRYLYNQVAMMRSLCTI